MVSIRGAITLEENSRDEIINSTNELLLEIETRNKLDRENVISILFSSTKDLNAEYPAKAARALGYTQCGLMCFNEMEVIDSLRKCIRILILYNGDMEQKDINHVYLREAKALRTDLNNQEQ